MFNMLATVANYTQRVGSFGRKACLPGYAVTFLGETPNMPYYNNPIDLIDVNTKV